MDTRAVVVVDRITGRPVGEPVMVPAVLTLPELIPGRVGNPHKAMSDLVDQVDAWMAHTVLRTRRAPTLAIVWVQTGDAVWAVCPGCSAPFDVTTMYPMPDGLTCQSCFDHQGDGNGNRIR